MNFTHNRSRSPAVPWNGPCIAVDIDGDHVFAVRARRRFGHLQFTRVTWPEPVRKRTTVVACLRQRETIVRWISTPLASARKARAVLPSLLDIQLPFRLEECRYFLPLFERQPDGLMRGLAIVARDADIRNRLAELQGAGIDPHLLDQEGVALWTQSLLEFPPDDTVKGSHALLRVIVYYGLERVTLVIGQGRTMQFAHSMHSLKPDQLGRLIRTARDNLGLGGQSPIQWVWCGPAAADRSKIDTCLRDAGDDLRGHLAIADEPELYLPRALAARALAATAIPCNFRADDLTHDAVVRHREHVSTMMASACLVAGIFLIVVNVLWRGALSATAGATQIQLQSAAQTLMGRKAQKGLELLESQRYLDALAHDSAPFARASGISLADTLSRLLAGAATNETTFSHLSLSRVSLDASGSGPTWEACERLGNLVKSMGYKVHLERIESSNTSPVLFSLKTGDVQ